MSDQNDDLGAQLRGMINGTASEEGEENVSAASDETETPAEGAEEKEGAAAEESAAEESGDDPAEEEAGEGEEASEEESGDETGAEEDAGDGGGDRLAAVEAQLTESNERIDQLIDYIKVLKEQTPKAEPEKLPDPEYVESPFVANEEELGEITSSVDSYNKAMNKAAKYGMALAVEHFNKVMPEMVSTEAARSIDTALLVRDFYKANTDLKRLGPGYMGKVHDVFTELQKKNPGATTANLMSRLAKEVRLKHKLPPLKRKGDLSKQIPPVPGSGGAPRGDTKTENTLGDELKKMEAAR